MESELNCMSVFLKNRMYEKINRGEMALGMQLRTRSPMIAELIGLSGFDFIYIETEHVLCNDETLEHLCRAAALTGCTPIVRIGSCDPERIMQILDAGAMGLILPHVESREQARALVQAAKFPPIGTRSGGTTRAAAYGLMKQKEFYAASNQSVITIAMIETVKGMENLDEILDEGIDVVRIGLGDLSQSLGHIGEPHHPEVTQAIRFIIDKCKNHGVSVGTKAGSVQEAQEFWKIGITHLNLGSDMSILTKQFPKIETVYRQALTVNG